ncbi:MAG: hypothetical protein KAX47_06340 [Zoogloea sp.]|nr:hypothetical protein [Zoogloea sp.]
MPEPESRVMMLAGLGLPGGAAEGRGRAMQGASGTARTGCIGWRRRRRLRPQPGFGSPKSTSER